MKLKLAMALSLVTVCAGTALADTISFTGKNAALGHSQSYSSSSGAISVTAYGFGTNGASSNLFGKNGGGSENGVGISGTVDNEISKLTFVQLDVSAIKTPYSLSIGSTQQDEGFSIYFSNVLGTLGTLSQDVSKPTTDPFSTTNLSTPLGDRYVSIIADGNQGTSANGAGNVLLDGLTTTAVTPEPNSLVLLGTGILGVAGIMRKKLFA